MTKELKKSQLYSQMVKSDKNDYLYDLKKKSADLHNFKNSRKSLKSNDSSNYEIINTPNNMYFEQYKKGNHKGSIMTGDSKDIETANYATANHKGTTKKYLTKKINLAADGKSCPKKAKKMKITSRNSNVTSHKNSTSRKFECLKF